MIELKGTRNQIADVIKGISATYPVDIITHLDSGEWHFIVNGVDVRVWIEDDE